MKIIYAVNQQSGPKISLKTWNSIVNKIEKNLKFAFQPEISIALVGKAAIRNLNRIYRKKDKVTDVLSFNKNKNTPDFWPKNYLGEVIICYPQAKAQAQKAKTPVIREIELLLIHGFLHLAGYDHEKAKDAEKMEFLEQKIIKTKI